MHLLLERVNNKDKKSSGSRFSRAFTLLRKHVFEKAARTKFRQDTGRLGWTCPKVLGDVPAPCQLYVWPAAKPYGLEQHDPRPVFFFLAT